jgi:hypothetical protein
MYIYVDFYYNLSSQVLACTFERMSEFTSEHTSQCMFDCNRVLLHSITNRSLRLLSVEGLHETTFYKCNLCDMQSRAGPILR